MSLRLISGEPGPFRRGAPVVCVPVVACDEETIGTLHALLAHTAGSTPILLVGASPLLESLSSLLPEASHVVSGVTPTRAGEAATFNAAVEASSPGDLVLMRAGATVEEGWLEQLGAAARSDSTVASATPLSLGFDAAGFAPADVPDRLAGASLAVAERSLALHPKIAEMGPKCVYIRRSALDLAAPLNENAGLELGLEVLTLELMGLGMVHVLADDVIVGGDPAGAVAVGDRVPSSAAASDDIGAIVADTLRSDDHGSLRRVLNHTQTALRRMSVTIDGRALSPAVGGTQTYVIELILGLARAPRSISGCSCRSTSPSAHLARSQLCPA